MTFTELRETIGYTVTEYAFRMSGDGAQPLPDWHPDMDRALNDYSDDGQPADVTPTARAKRYWFDLVYTIGCYLS